MCIGLPADIVPATYKKKRVTTAGAPKVKDEEGDEKPGRPEGETARPAGLGRGARWWISAKRPEVADQWREID